MLFAQQRRNYSARLICSSSWNIAYQKNVFTNGNRRPVRSIIRRATIAFADFCCRFREFNRAAINAFQLSALITSAKPESEENLIDVNQIKSGGSTESNDEK